jgi:hypothetical protein
MSAKRKATPTAESARMLLAQSVSHISKQESAFIAAVEAFQGITAESVADLQRQLDVKQEEYRELCEGHEQDLKRRKIEVDLGLQEHKHAGARGVLDGFGEVPIVKEALEGLQAALAAAELALSEYKAHADEALALALAALEKKLKGESHAALAVLSKHKDLENKANVAELQAEAGQASKQVENLKATIADQRDEIKEQRKLTQSVAEASKQGQIQQSFGKAS